ncbi:MAG: ATPase, T2SS/T4P/T4SS family [Pseudomonadota bacterium]
MFSVLVKEKSGEQRRLEFDKSEVSIGRVQGNDVILPKGNVSKRHARIGLKDGKFIVADLKSTNGTYVNGRKITSSLVVKEGDNIYIGDFIINVEQKAKADLGDSVPPLAESARRPPPPPKRKARAEEIHEDIVAQAEREPAPRVPRETSTPHPTEPPENDMRPGPPDVSGPIDLGIGEENWARPREAAPEDLTADSGGGAMEELARSAPPLDIRAPISPKGREESPRQRASAESHGEKPRGKDPRREKVFELQKEVHDRLVDYLDLRRMDIDRLANEELWDKTERAIVEVVESMGSEGAIPAFVDQDALIKNALNEALGLGPLEDLLADEEVDEIMVNRADQVYVEKKGRLELTEYGFSSSQAVLGVIERIVAPLGRRIDESSPLVDARLKDGSRVNAIIPPLALKGPCLTIRKFAKEMFRDGDLIRFGSLNEEMVEFLMTCVSARKNIVISGGTGSGKTTTLNVVSNFIPDEERIISIEDAAELQLRHEHWIQLESRPANIEGKGAVAIRDLVRNALRMRPDRIVVGECRGGEALDMLQAMNTGHDGSLTTAHSNGPRDTLARLETMVLMSGMDLPIRAIREQIASAVDIIVHQMRFPDGSRRITHITEVSGMETDVIALQDIFVFKQEGFDEEGRVRGQFMPTGLVPRFYEDLRNRGIPVNMDIFG